MISLTHALLTVVFLTLAFAAIARRISAFAAVMLGVASILLILPIIVPAVQKDQFIVAYFVATGAAMLAGIVLFARANGERV